MRVAMRLSMVAVSSCPQRERVSVGLCFCICEREMSKEEDGIKPHVCKRRIV